MSEAKAGAEAELKEGEGTESKEARIRAARERTRTRSAKKRAIPRAESEVERIITIEAIFFSFFNFIFILICRYIHL